MSPKRHGITVIHKKAEGAFLSNGKRLPLFPIMIGSGRPVPVEVAQQSRDMGKLISGELAQFGDSFAQKDGRVERLVKEFSGCNAQKFTDSKKTGHGRQGLSIFNTVDIAGALA